MKPLIVAVDDSPTIRKIIELCLQREGYEVVTFADGIQAMHWMTEQKTVPHVILLALNLPKMDGFEVARRITRHQAFRQTGIILLSGRDGFKGRLVGAHAQITKPFKTEELIETVSQCIHAHTRKER